MSRNELARATGSGIRSTYEQVEELIALGALKEIGRKVAMEPEFPFYDSIRDLLLSSRDYPGTVGDVLRLVDRSCDDSYYIGAFTAARQAITPTDYDPSIYAVRILGKFYRRLCPRIKALGKLSGVRVYENAIGEETGDVATLVVAARESIPPDVKRTGFLNTEVWMASVERGLIECLVGDTPFAVYGAYLALLLNAVDGTIDLPYFKKLASEGNCLPKVLSILREFNEASGKTIFELTETEKKMARRVADKKEIRHAINTVIG